MASGHSADRSNTATPMMLWPEARRSPRVGIVGATPTPSADIHATARPAAASSRRCSKRRRRSSGNCDSAHVDDPVHAAKCTPRNEIPFEAYKARFVQFGMSQAMAQGMTYMAAAKNQGLDNAVRRTPENSTPTSFRQWCEEVLKPAVARL
jgi:hypothetical protein